MDKKTVDKYTIVGLRSRVYFIMQNIHSTDYNLIIYSNTEPVQNITMDNVLYGLKIEEDKYYYHMNFFGKEYESNYVGREVNQSRIKEIREIFYE